MIVYCLIFNVWAYFNNVNSLKEGSFHLHYAKLANINSKNLKIIYELSLGLSLEVF